MFLPTTADKPFLKGNLQIFPKVKKPLITCMGIGQSMDNEQFINFPDNGNGTSECIEACMYCFIHYPVPVYKLG